jgi:large subunit ribosomal protein L54
MICRTCFRQAARLTSRQVTTQPLARTAAAAATRSFATTFNTRNAAPSPVAAAPATTSAEPSSTPDLTPLTPGAGDAAAAPLSSCPPGTVLSGLNYFKGKTDPVSLPDEAYPSWLWNCLEVQKKAATAADADLGDEYC